MDFLYLLENIRVPGLNELMLAITTLGDEVAFLLVAIVIYWCVDKKLGYYVLSVGFIGAVANQFLKLLCRVPRPWVRDENFTILEQAREAASGYSFPSGHTQNAVGTFGALAYTAKRSWVRWICVAIAVLVAFSRMYIGVHTPADVLFSVALAILLIIILRPVVFGNSGKNVPVLLSAMTVIASAFVCFVEWYPFPADMDAQNLQSGIKNAYTFFGALLAFLMAYFADRRYIHFDTRAIWWAQILKVVGGLALVLAVKSGLKAPLNALLGQSWGSCARYFLMVIVLGILWPMTFQWFSKMGRSHKATDLEA